MSGIQKQNDLIMRKHLDKHKQKKLFHRGRAFLYMIYALTTLVACGPRLPCSVSKVTV